MDFFIDNLYKKVILEHLKNKDIWDDVKIKAREVQIWKATTRNMFRNYPALNVFEMVDDCLAEASDQQYFEDNIVARAKKGTAIMEGQRKNTKVKGVVRKEIDKRYKITDIAKQFGHQVDGKGKVLCPFHADGTASCYLNDKKNIFHCFGCSAKGDVIEFYRRLKEGETTRSGG